MATFSYNHSFTPATAAKASEVNANFNAVKTFAEAVSTGAQLDAGAVTEQKILNGSVTTDKLAVSAVTTDKINNSAVTNAKLDYASVPQITVSGSAPANNTVGKNGDIWIVV